jgi:hypothetical protein
MGPFFGMREDLTKLSLLIFPRIPDFLREKPASEAPIKFVPAIVPILTWL